MPDKDGTGPIKGGRGGRGKGCGRKKQRRRVSKKPCKSKEVSCLVKTEPAP